jgi:hypothetical protein
MTFRRPVAICAFLFALVALAITPPCAALGPQTPAGFKPIYDPRNLPYELRTDAFRRLLFELRFQPLSSPEVIHLNPSETLLIVLGNPVGLSMGFVPEGLRSFVEAGGAVLIATDMETTDEAGENLRNLAGVTVTGKKLVVRLTDDSPIWPDVVYSNSRYCPFVKPTEDSKILGALAAFIGAGSKPDLFHRHPYPNQRPLQVATNAPSYLEPSRERLPFGIYKLARLPQVCQDESSNPNEPGKAPVVDEKGPLFAVGGTVGKGRVLVLADHSIFINRMILPRDNGNLEFAANCLHWLRGGVSNPMEGFRGLNGPDALQQLAGQRNKALLCDDGFICTDFEVPLKSTPAPPSLASEPAIVAAIDKTLTRLEESDAFNRALLEWMDDLPGGRERVVRIAVYLLTLAMLLLLGYRFLWHTRHRPELAVPSLSKALREHEPKAPLLDQRRRALLRSGNVWEMGHRLARECFESAGVSLTGAAPRVVMACGSRWQRWRVRRRVAHLWQLARSNFPKPLSPAALQHRLREIEELKSALGNGTIVLKGIGERGA